MKIDGKDAVGLKVAREAHREVKLYFGKTSFLLLKSECRVKDRGREATQEVFGADVKEHLFHEVVVSQLASKRAGTKAGKERAAVRGSTRKIYKQKGTGNARHGDIRAPIFAGGGRAHPPKPQDFSHRPPVNP